MKTLIAALAVTAALTAGVVQPAAAKDHQQQTTNQQTIDYGTGYYGPGTATGGPAGGLPNRN